MVSIIIVNYHVKKELFACLSSIYTSKPKVKFEIIVVDNDEKKSLQTDLKKQFPKVKYIANENKGFGQGNNVGAQNATGDYFFFLNPDTTVAKESIDMLVSYLDSHRKVGIVAPMLLDKAGTVVYLQGARKLTPLRAIFSFSFLNKFLPNNPIAEHYWYLNEWNKQSAKEVESIPGTAFVIRRRIYEEIRGFDESFFLYFEEHDLCNRVMKLGWKIVMLPEANVFHILGSSTKQLKNDANTILRQSRYYYFRKHFGVFNAFFTETVLRISNYSLLLFLVLLLGGFLRLVHIQKSMVFIGDQGWFYLSARDMLLTGHIPLIGIASSHPWLHQGALWTYLLAVVLLFFHFNPISGAYLSTLLDLFAIVALYKLGSFAFSKRVGIIAAALYATSPLVILNVRMPYHTSPIPLFTTVLLYSIYKWIDRKKYYFPLVITMLALLYNLEIATFLLTIAVLFIAIYGMIKQQKWAHMLWNPQIVIFSIIGFLLAMLPMFMYDIHHGFPQTVKFLAWGGYKLIALTGIVSLHAIQPVSFSSVLAFFSDSYRQIVYPFSGILSILIASASAAYVIVSTVKSRKRNSIILVFITAVLCGGFFIAKTASYAYFPMMFPGTFLILALFFNWAYDNKYSNAFSIPLLVLIMAFNSCYMFYLLYGKTNDTFSHQLAAANEIIKKSAGKEYNLKGRGEGSQFESFTMNYTYLTWWLGHGPSKSSQPLRFVIEEKPSGILVTNEDKKHL